jgi:AraC-like DNA-binding protein
VRFRDAVERDFARTRRLEDYARALGYSPRTLSRATLAGAGVGAKEFIDRRVILEAKRLLAHGNQSASRIGAQLGFTSANNFSKYFQQRTGQSPITFRATVRGRSSESGRGVPGTGRPGR